MLPFRARVDLGVMAMKGYSAFPKFPASLEPHHQIVLCNIQETRWRRSYPFAEVQSVYSPASPADWTSLMSNSGHSLRWGSYHSAEKQSVYSTALPPADWASLVSYPGHSLAELLPLCREAVGVFYSPLSRLGKFSVILRTLVDVEEVLPFYKYTAEENHKSKVREKIKDKKQGTNNQWTYEIKMKKEKMKNKRMILYLKQNLNTIDQCSICILFRSKRVIK